MPRKSFSAGDVLTASDVNTFLMDQSVMTFADSGARGSAIGTATEGMLTYLEDTDAYQSWNGSAWVGVGGGAATNAIINGAFEINQRNFSSGTVNALFGFDRWVLSKGGTSDPTVTYSSQAFTAGTAPVAGYNGTNFARIATTTGSSANEFVILAQKVEDIRTLAGQTLTVSFWAKAASGTPKIGIELEANVGSGGSGATSAAGQAVTISTAWTRYSVTITTPSLTGVTIGTSSAYSLNLWMSAGSNSNTRTGSIGNQTATIDIWGVQVEAGSTATPFRRNANSLQGELAACQRYFLRSNSRASWSGNTTNGTIYICYVPFPVAMRATPTIVNTALANGGFSGTPSVSNSGTDSFTADLTANATAPGSYFQFAYTASAEL
jgi:hypothetical protein